MSVDSRIIQSMPDTIAKSNEPVNLSFVLLTKTWRQVLIERYTVTGWIEGKNTVTVEPSATVISLDEISKIENNNLAFAGNNDYIPLPIDSKHGFFVVRIPFARDHFRVWRYKRVGQVYYLKGSATYDEGFRVYDLHITQSHQAIEELHTIFKSTINRAKTREQAIRDVQRIEIGHLVTEFTRTRKNSAFQCVGRTSTIKKAKEQWLNPTGKEILWSGEHTICFI